MSDEFLNVAHSLEIVLLTHIQLEVEHRQQGVCVLSHLERLKTADDAKELSLPLIVVNEELC